MGHDRERNNMVLGNQMKRKNCEKEKLKLLFGLAHTQLLFPFLQITGKILTLVSAIIWGGNCIKICAIH
jgi:hypothetical protein